MAEKIEPYTILGLEPGAEMEEIKSAYRYLSKKYHPDSSGRSDTGIRFMRVVKAYRTLKYATAKKPYPAPSSAQEEDLFALGAKALGSSDPKIRCRAIRRLGFTGKKSAYVFLRRCLSDGDDAARAAAVRAIADLSAYQASGEIAALWARSPEPFRRTILEIAETTGEPLFKNALELAVQDGGMMSLRARRILLEHPKISV